MCGAEDATDWPTWARGAAGSAGGAADSEAAEREGERGAGAARPGGARPADPSGRAGWRVCQTAHGETAGEGQYPEVPQVFFLQKGWSAGHSVAYAACKLFFSLVVSCLMAGFNANQVQGKCRQTVAEFSVSVRHTNMRFWGDRGPHNSLFSLGITSWLSFAQCTQRTVQTYCMSGHFLTCSVCLAAPSCFFPQKCKSVLKQSIPGVK